MLLPAGFVGFDESVALLKADIVALHGHGIKLKCGHDVGLSCGRTACHCPRALLSNLFVGTARTLERKHYFLHHLSDDTVGKHHDGIAVLECKVETESDKISHLLNGSRSEDYQAIVSVAASFGGLKIVGLRGLYSSETGPSSHTVYDECRELSGCYVGDALLL